MATDPDKKLNDLLDGFTVAMLVTRTPRGQLRARPMVLADNEPDGTIWFITDRNSGKMDEVSEDRQALVTLQSSSAFVSLSGKISTVDDRAKIARVWRAEFQAWFPEGKDDPDAVLLRVDGQAAEYWDNGGLSGLKYVFEASKALLTGERVDVDHDPRIHAKVTL